MATLDSDLTRATPGSTLTPLMKQYWDLKAQAGDALLFFRMGDFYELFGDDAILAAQILEITLTSRDRNKPNPTPMAGVPHHSAQSYIQRLLHAGKKVAIGEQMEDPSSVSGKAIVRREITRIFTPGVQFDADGTGSNFLATVFPDQAHWVFAALDAATGECLISNPLSASHLAQEIAGVSLPIRHWIRLENIHFPDELASLQSGLESLKPSGDGGVLIEKLPSNLISLPQALTILRKNYEIEDLSAFVTCDAATLALGLLVHYAAKTQQLERLAHLQIPAPLQKPRALHLGPRTAQHLDLLPSSDGTPSLYELLLSVGRARSALGARQLRRWLLAPLREVPEIAERQTAVRELLERNPSARERLSDFMAEIYDIERITGRISARLASPRDTLQLGLSLLSLQKIASTLSEFESAALQALSLSFQRASSELSALGEKITQSQLEDAPPTSREGRIFKQGTHPELDRWIELNENGQRFLVDLETSEREKTGIASLKVRYNRVFGYYIEVTQAHLAHVPPHYQRKQTTAGGERFFTEELKNFEEEILTASSRQKALEQQIFEELLAGIQEKTKPLMEVAQNLGQCDALVALSRLGDEAGWNFPVIDSSMDFKIEAGRHPLVDQRQSPSGKAAGGSFIPNDLALSPGSRLTLLITGPNMGGKSTVMRQCALIVILGQMGAPVPALHAQWGSVSSLYTRIGAHDSIARGQSTFMVEMSELAHILHFADSRSFLVLDEIGRGTSTYDGMSVAWATLEWICGKIGARTLFATHYHELTGLEGRLPQLANAHMAVAREEKMRPDASPESARNARDLRFLYLLKEGPTNESFGIHVARLAGLPKQVIERAWSVLEELESAKGAPLASPLQQLSFFSEAPPLKSTIPHETLERLKRLESLAQDIRAMDPNRMTPIEALTAISAIQKQILRDQD